MCIVFWLYCCANSLGVDSTSRPMRGIPPLAKSTPFSHQTHRIVRVIQTPTSFRSARRPPINGLSVVHIRTHTATFCAHNQVIVTVNNRHRRDSDERVECYTSRRQATTRHTAHPRWPRCRAPSYPEKRVAQSDEPINRCRLADRFQHNFRRHHSYLLCATGTLTSACR
ncbi:hypothetical protein EDB85DRAFT_321289 [Lactarius pseudohatsudake]|nr:hypothetical protein EDB85DRAFT_321289 [Lactarius pseudohatsudake]